MPLVKKSDLDALERRVAALEEAQRKTTEPKRTASATKTATAATQKKEAD